MKICLAGLNSLRKENHNLLNKIPFVLESFYYIKDFELPLIKQAELFVLDSGAFTFMSNHKKSVDWDEYVTKYIKFINDYDVKYFFELDIDSVVGYDRVIEIRERIERETGRKCIPVWHKSRGIEEWKKHCEEYDYIAIGGIVTKEISKKEWDKMKKLVQYANHRGVKVHGLGFTPVSVEQWGFYSCDSTSWLSFSRFGTLYRFTGTKMVTSKKQEGKKINPQRYVEAEENNVREWIKYQEYLRAR